MKHHRILYILILFVLVNACETGGEAGGEIEPLSPELKTLDPSPVSETEIQLNWSITNPVGFNTIQILLTEDEEMTRRIKFSELDDISAENVTFEGLKGATDYYYKISLLNNGTTVTESQVKRVKTVYKVQNFTLLTEDGYSLTANLAYLESESGSRPGIIMMHEFGVFVNPWVGSALLEQLVAEGYICLTFFNRGHGTSTPVDDLMDLIDNKSLLTKDLQAAIDTMNAHELVSGTLGLIGGSMGAILALAGNGYEEVHTSVALSPTRDGVFLIFPNMTLTSVYYLVGELDIRDQEGADFPAETRVLYDMTEEPRRLNIIPGTMDHGTSLLSRDSLNTSIHAWFTEQLPID